MVCGLQVFVFLRITGRSQRRLSSNVNHGSHQHFFGGGLQICTQQNITILHRKRHRGDTPIQSQTIILTAESSLYYIMYITWFLQLRII